MTVLRKPRSASVHSWGGGHGAAPHLLFPTLSPSWDPGRGGLSVSATVTAPRLSPHLLLTCFLLPSCFGARWLLWGVHRFWHKQTELKPEGQARWVPGCDCMWCVQKPLQQCRERTVKWQVMEPCWVSPLHSLLSGTLVLTTLVTL